LFEVLKIKLVEKPLGERLRVKQGLDDTLFDQRSGGGLTLQLNILDAMYEDTLLGNDTNAEAGFELMAHAFDKDPQPLVGERYTDEWHLDGKPMGVGRCHMAFADAWVMLYSSWNGAFCANYPELVFAKLFNPGVAGAAIAYGPEVYFSPRVPTLFITLVLMVLSRERAGARRYGRVDWRDEALRMVWGRVNEVAAGAYQDRVEKALAEDWAAHARYRATRASQRAGWLALRTVIKGARLAGDVDPGELFQQVAQMSGLSRERDDEIAAVVTEHHAAAKAEPSPGPAPHGV
jgi:hypothetical protein